MKHKLILAKTASWYVLHFILVSLLATFITHDWSIGVTLASAELVFETLLYYWHEHLWVWIRKTLQWN